LDLKAGILLRRKIGHAVEAGEVLAEILTDRDEGLDEMRRRLNAAFRIGPAPLQPPPLIISFVDATGVHPWSR
jgi:thymidine phosphorylase